MTLISEVGTVKLVYRGAPEISRPIATAELHTVNGAEIYARYADDEFKVALDDDFDTAELWYFDEASCREAAAFFTMLADNLAEHA